MSTDKLQASHEALADAFAKLPLTHPEASHPAFDHEALSEIFSESQQISTNTESSHRASDNEALSEMFGESRQLSTENEPPHPASNREALSDIFSEPHLISTNTELSSPIFDNGAFAELFSEPLPISTNTNPSLPGFDYQALADILSEARLVPIDPHPSPPSFDAESPSRLPPGRLDSEEPVAKAEGARTQRARGLLTKLHQILSTKVGPPPSHIEKDPSLPSFSGQPHRPEPAANATASLAEAVIAIPHWPSLTELRPQTLAGTEPPPIVEKNPAAEDLWSGMQCGACGKNHCSCSSTPRGTSRVQQPRSLLVEPVSPTSTNREPSPSMFGKEPAQPALFGRQTNVEPSEKINHPEPTASADSTDAENTEALHGAAHLPQSQEACPVIREKDASRPTLSGQPDNVEPATIVAVATPASTESARPQEVESLPVVLPASISIHTKSSSADFQTESSPLTFSGQFDSAGPAVSTGVALPKSPPLPNFEMDRPVPASIIVSTESAVMQPREENLQLSEDPSLHSIMLKSLPHTFGNETLPTNEELAVRAVATLPLVETESAVTRAQKAKSLLAELDLNTAIRLRWVLRDIRSKRTKLSPVSHNDLAALMNLGLVEMGDELPRLTALGVLGLD